MAASLPLPAGCPGAEHEGPAELVQSHSQPDEVLVVTLWYYLASRYTIHTDTVPGEVPPATLQVYEQ